MLEKSPLYDPINDDIPDDDYDIDAGDGPPPAADVAGRKPEHDPINDDIPDDARPPETGADDERLCAQRRREHDQWMRQWRAVAELGADPAPRRETTDHLSRREVTVASSYLGARLWRRVGERGHTTRSGAQISLAVWEAPCAVCGAPFQIATPTGVAGSAKTLGAITCRAHRMTPSEVAKLRFAKAEKRRDVFEAIKRKKLAP
jgi:hypothetical protein